MIITKHIKVVYDNDKIEEYQTIKCIMKGDLQMIKTVSTFEEAIKIARKLSSTYPIKIVDSVYKSDKDFKGIILHVVKEG